MHYAYRVNLCVTPSCKCVDNTILQGWKILRPAHFTPEVLKYDLPFFHPYKGHVCCWKFSKSNYIDWNLSFLNKSGCQRI